MNYQIDTTKLKTIQEKLTQIEKFVSNKNHTFYSGAFRTKGNLSNGLIRIQNIYHNVSKNLKNIELYLKDYTEDIEAYENVMTSGNGFVKVSEASSSIFLNQVIRKNSLFSYEMDPTTLFNIRKYTPKNSSSNSSFTSPSGPAG
ncbi:MAG: hypothetical protein HFI09_01710, partial [Bacilli bacterium]|nr:hypothetical protein [Bacilli bacterium]